MGVCGTAFHHLDRRSGLDIHRVWRLENVGYIRPSGQPYMTLVALLGNCQRNTKNFKSIPTTPAAL
jgi:hypothetical protein